MRTKTETKDTMGSLSIFDIFKIGVGPSSSHTLGPWKAANNYIEEMPQAPIQRVQIHLYGSLSKTGKGHGTDIATLLGLMGYDPKTIDTQKIDLYIQEVKDNGQLRVGDQTVTFDFEKDIIYEEYALDYHPNGMKISTNYADGQSFETTYFSVGGGFIEKENEEAGSAKDVSLPFPIETGADLTRHCETENKNIYEIVQLNELVWNNPEEILAKLTEIWQVMKECIYRGCHTEGILPGGLNVRRRAYEMNKKMIGDASYSTMEEWLDIIKNQKQDFVSINNWVSCFALAVNEENAAFGRIVTSPTNGAAGVIPAVIMYYKLFTDHDGSEQFRKFFLTAGEIGCMFKKRATISAAVGGCQAEIGVSSAMAAGGLTALLGGSAKHILNAAEIAMEHHLGLTCDPIGGLVQIPCIERNSMGAIKAITASHLSLSTEPSDAIVNFDTVVKTMWETAVDMSVKYKETSEGGLAINLSVIQPSC